MASQALQELVKKVFGGETTKARFAADPVGFLSEFRLTADERRAVLATHAKLGLVDGDSAALQADIGPTYFWL